METLTTKKNSFLSNINQYILKQADDEIETFQHKRIYICEKTENIFEKNN